MTKWWTNWPWRMIQTNLREIDMLDMDAHRFVQELQSFKATAVLVNSAGIIASYPSQLPYHFVSPYLQGDSLADIIAACHAANIKVLARTDFSKVRRPIYEQHPEWAYVSPQGHIVDYNGDVHVCLNGGYQQEYALKIIEELITTHDVDGIFFNMAGYQVRDYSGNYYGICHCDNCKARFAEFSGGLDLPRAEDNHDPVYRKYVLFKQQTSTEHHHKVYNWIKSLRPDLLIANHTEFREGLVRQESNTAIERPLPHWQYSASDNTKWVTSSYPEMVSSNTTVDFIDFPYRHVAVSPDQQALRLAQDLANGGGIDYYLIGRLDNHEDKSGYEGIRRIFHYHAAHEQDYGQLTSRATIALLNGPDADRDEYQGWFRFLVENHYLFDVLMVDTALELPWDKYEAVIVPNLQPLSDALADRIDRFAEAGGTVIAVSQAGLQTDAYVKRNAPALHCLGIERINRVRSDMRASYLKIGGDDAFQRFPVTDLIYLDGNYVYADYAAQTALHLKLVPPHNFGPPERCYYTQVTNHPGFTVHPFGQGQGIYIPWEPGKLYRRQGYTNTLDFVADVLEHVARLRPVKGNLSPMVEVTLFEKRDGSHQLLHLVNGSGHFGVSFFAPVTMVDVQIEVPRQAKPRAVESLVTGQTYPFDIQGDTLRVTVPRLELFDALKIVP